VRFKLLVTGWNCAALLPRCVRSIARQIESAYDVCLVDDASDDPHQAATIQAAARQYGWQHILNPERRGALYNQYQAVQRLRPEENDVLVFLDADDRLAHDGVLQRLRHYYERYRPLLTYGSYHCDPPDTDVTPARNFPATVVQTNSYRSFSARDDPDAIWFNHLRTVRYSLFRELGPSDFTFADGSWFMACCDTAVMVPCLELAGGRHLMIPEQLYTYTRDNLLSDCRVSHNAIAAAHQRIFHELPVKPPLLPLTQPTILPAASENCA
jgi:glycosyltransferase involved in cell wall biosynthesis